MKNIQDKIRDDLTALGVRKNGILLVHSSLRTLGDIPDRAEILTGALINTLGENGTLIVPALSYEFVGKDNPHFDVLKTPSCVGGFTEYFRIRLNTIRSIHPTHSICGIGKMAESLLMDHKKDTTPCGQNSPIQKLKNLEGQILFFGCGLKPNTSMHGIEELIEPPYLFGDVVSYTITDQNGVTYSMNVKSHDFKGWVQRYDRLEDVLNYPDLKKGKVLGADSYLIEAKSMWEKVSAVLKNNPLYFVDKKI